jgi:hypothetical protein
MFGWRLFLGSGSFVSVYVMAAQMMQHRRRASECRLRVGYVAYGLPLVMTS